LILLPFFETLFKLLGAWLALQEQNVKLSQSWHLSLTPRAKILCLSSKTKSIMAKLRITKI